MTSTLELRSVVLIPTFNEVESIAQVVSSILEHTDLTYVLVVDDSSPDGTADAVERHEGYGDRVGLMVRSGRTGLADAYRQAMSWAIANGYERIVQMDADGSHLPSALPALMAACRSRSTLVVGTRWMEGGEVRNWSAYRQLLSTLGNYFARKLLRCTVPDMTSGFRVWGDKALEHALRAESRTMSGYGFQIEMAWRHWLSGNEVVSSPICFVERNVGRSKMSTRIAVEAFCGVIRLRFSRPQQG